MSGRDSLANLPCGSEGLFPVEVLALVKVAVRAEAEVEQEAENPKFENSVGAKIKVFVGLLFKNEVVRRSRKPQELTEPRPKHSA